MLGVHVGGIYTIRFKTSVTCSCICISGMGLVSYPAGEVIQGVTVTSLEHVEHPGLSTYGLRWPHTIEPGISATIDTKVSAQIIDLFVEEMRVMDETCLHTPTFEALLKQDGMLYLSGSALAEGFSVSDVQALTRFLSERVTLPPLEPLYNFEDFTPKRVEE